jgi:hypothetical protein
MKTYVKYLFIILVVVLILAIISDFDYIALADVRRDRYTGEKIYDGYSGDDFFEFLALAFIFFGGMSEIYIFIAILIYKYTGI